MMKRKRITAKPKPVRKVQQHKRIEVNTVCGGWDVVVDGRKFSEHKTRADADLAAKDAGKA